MGLVVGCMGLPLQAKELYPVLTQTQGKSGLAAKRFAKTPATPCAAKKEVSARLETSGQAKSPEKSPASMASSISTDKPARSAVKPTSATGASEENVRGGRLARVTAYWAGEGDYYTGHDLSATGIHLHDGHCAVDPSIIPYGSVVEIAGVGKYLAVDTGSAVISRTAAREAAHTPEEHDALVIDLFFESREDGERFAANGPKYATIRWQAPRTADNATKESIGLIAEQSWNRLPSKQL
jgi:3D (Asp-Asp-Asp) domain-containing protein